MAASDSYLREAGGRYSFRRRIPSHLRPLAGSGEVVRSLQASSPREAQKQARSLVTATDQWFARLAKGEACALAVLAANSDCATTLALARPARKRGQAKSAAAGDAGPTFRQAADRYVAACATTWIAKTAQQNRTTYRLFASLVGEVAVREVRRSHVAEFVDLLRRLPASYARSPDNADKGLLDLVRGGSTRAPAEPGLSTKTIARHLSALSGLFGWVEQQGLRDELNPAQRFKLKAAGGNAPKRRPWRSQELATLFSSPVWTGCAPASQRTARDARYWLPLLALFTGMRLEELCKLAPGDVRDAGGFRVLDVLANEHGRVKEDASNRTVPLHPALVELGFLEHVEARREAGSALLFPELRRAGPDKRLGSAFTKWFGRYCTKIGLSDPALTFHSFRKNLATALHRAGISESIAADILGHAHKTTSYRIYSEGTAAKPLYEAICKVEYDLDLSHLVPGDRP